MPANTFLFLPSSTRPMMWRAASSRSSSGEAGLLTGLALLHGAVLLAAPVVPVVALGLWWNANTVAHNFLHRPFFATPRRNRVFSCYLSLLLGFPQPLWRRRHLAHHAGRRAGWAPRRGERMEYLLSACLWGSLAALAPAFLLAVYLPGFLIGQGLCALQGHYEHRGGTTSHYGRVYNWLFLNDGYHVEHHAHPGAGFRELARRRRPGTRASAWPPVLRWLDSLGAPSVAACLDRLERLALRSPRIRGWVLGRHRRALLRVLSGVAPLRRVAIVGGGLFPRTAILLRELLPEAELVVIEGRAEHLAQAEPWLAGTGATCRVAWFDPRRDRGFDLVVLPLALRGNRTAFLEARSAPFVLVHDWIWNRPGHGAVVSPLLLKRVHLVRIAKVLQAVG